MTSQFIKLTVVSCLLVTGTSVLAQNQPQTQTGFGGGSINRTETSSVEVGLSPNLAQFVENYSLNVLQGYENGTLSYSYGREEVADDLRRKLGDPQLQLGGRAQTVALVGDSGSGRTYTLNQFILDNPTYDVIRIRLDLLIAKIPDKATQAKTLKEILISLRDQANKSPGGLIVYMDKVSALNIGSNGVNTLDTIKELIVSDNAPPMILEMNQGTYTALTSDENVKNKVRYVNNTTPPSVAIIEHLRQAKLRVEARYPHVSISEAVIEQVSKIARQYLQTDTFARAEDLLMKIAYAVENDIYSDKVSVNKLKKELASLETQIQSLQSDLAVQPNPETKRKLTELNSKVAEVKSQIGQLENTRILPLKVKIRDLEDQKAAEVEKLKAHEMTTLRFWNVKKAHERRAISREITRLSYELKMAQDELATIEDTKVTGARPRVQATAMDVKKEAEKMLNISLTEFGLAADRLLEAKDRVFNQDHIVDEIALVMRTADMTREMEATEALREGKQVSKRAIYSAIFFGETGTGKTEIAKEIAHALGYDKNPNLENGILRIDMNDFMEKHSVSRLVGPPPGYVGFDLESFADKIARNPNCVLLLDELEKAHPDVMKALMTMMDEGYLTDSKGNKVYLTNAVIIATSNFGVEFYDESKWPVDQLIEFLSSTKVASELPGDGTVLEKLKKMNRKELALLATKHSFMERYGPEIGARFDRIFSTNSHTQDSRRAVVAKLLNNSLRSFAQTYQIEVRVSESAFEHMVGMFRNSGGARSAKAAVKFEIQNHIIDLYSKKQLVPGDVLVVHSNGGSLDFTVHSRADFERVMGTSTSPDQEVKTTKKRGLLDSILSTAKETKPDPMQKATRGFTEKFMIRDAVAGALRKLGR